MTSASQTQRSSQLSYTPQVPAIGLEPIPLFNREGILSPSRLPIPPRRPVNLRTYFIKNGQETQVSNNSPQNQNAPDFSRGMNGLFGAFGTGFRLENKEKPPALAGGGSQSVNLTPVGKLPAKKTDKISCPVPSPDIMKKTNANYRNKY